MTRKIKIVPRALMRVTALRIGRVAITAPIQFIGGGLGFFWPIRIIPHPRTEAPPMISELSFVDPDTFGLTGQQKKRALDAALVTMKMMADFGSGPDDGLGLLVAMADCLAVAVHIAVRRGHVKPEQADIIIAALTRAKNVKRRTLQEMITFICEGTARERARRGFDHKPLSRDTYERVSPDSLEDLCDELEELEELYLNSRETWLMLPVKKIEALGLNVAQTVIGHPFEAGGPKSYCKRCGWPKENHQ